MVYSGTFCTEDEVKMKAGKGYNSTDVTQDRISEFVLQAEAEINVATKFNWTDEYANLNTDVKGILAQAASNLAGIYMICYDMSGYSSRTEAEDMINVLRDGYLRCLALLREESQKHFMKNA